jgi:hypothetical protein
MDPDGIKGFGHVQEYCDVRLFSLKFLVILSTRRASCSDVLCVGLNPNCSSRISPRTFTSCKILVDGIFSNKPAPGKAKKKGAASVKTAAAKHPTLKLVVPTQFSSSPLEEISDLQDHLPIQACVKLTRRPLTTISSLPTGAARPPAVLKTVILFVTEYGNTP